MSETQNKSSDALFEELSMKKKQRKNKIIRTVAIAIAVVAVILIAGVSIMTKRVQAQFGSAGDEVLSFAAERGTISTKVSGSGTLAQVDQEELVLPSGVEITEVMVDTGDMVSKGDLLATVDMSTVMTALADIQEQLDDLEDDINAASGDKASSYITAGVAGRVKIIYAEAEMDVSGCMADHGALAILSLGGNMAVDIETDKLSKGETVDVALSDGTVVEGTVESVTGNTATIYMTDNGPKFEEPVSVAGNDGTTLGSGKLYIPNSLAVTGYAGTISNVNTSENSYVYSNSTLFTLKNTSFSANYDSLLRQRDELKETLLELLTIYRDGAVLAPMDGMITDVAYDEDNTVTTVSGYATMSDSSTGDGTTLLTLYPNLSMSVTISVDETDILALALGQEAEVEVTSVSEEKVFTGVVTDISKVADTSSGVTKYSAQITLDKAEGMLPGMTASVDVKIEGVENALIIPVDALHQTSAIYYVYTSYDEETETYGGMVEVTVGMQNDDYAEITSGLQEGDTVYYVESQEAFDFGAMFGGGGNPFEQGGGMPSGGGNPFG